MVDRKGIIPSDGPQATVVNKRIAAMEAENAALRAALDAAEKLAAACDTFRLEMDSPVPDAIYRSVLRQDIYKKSAAFRAAILGSAPDA